MLTPSLKDYPPASFVDMIFFCSSSFFSLYKSVHICQNHVPTRSCHPSRLVSLDLWNYEISGSSFFQGHIFRGVYVRRLLYINLRGCSSAPHHRWRKRSTASRMVGKMRRAVSLLFLSLMLVGVLFRTTHQISRDDFPPGFVFGAGTSALQVRLLSLVLLVFLVLGSGYLLWGLANEVKFVGEIL